MRYTTYLHYSSFYQKHRLPFHIVTPVVTIIHCGPFEYVSEVILQLNSLYEAILQLKLIVYDTTAYTAIAIHSRRHRRRSGCQSNSLCIVSLYEE